MFYKGILMTNWNNDKGTVLGEFFKLVGWSPAKVLFFDDRKIHLKEVEKEMQKLRPQLVTPYSSHTQGHQDSHHTIEANGE